MGKTRGVHETTPELRNRMVGMYEAGLGLREIAAAVNCSQRTVKRWLNRFDKEGTVETRERCGRKRATTAEQDEAIVRLATQTPITAAKAVLPALGLTCSVDTVRERLHKAGIHNWSPSRKYMQRIPLGEADGAAIQQAVWRPTGTQLGKKKPSKDSSRNDKNPAKKRHPPRKVRARDVYVGDGAPLENQKKSNDHQQFLFPQQTDAVTRPHTDDMGEQQPPPPPPPPPPPQQQPQLQPQPQPQPQPQHHHHQQQHQQQRQPLPTEFVNVLSASEQQQPVYQQTGIQVVHSWSLDLVHGSHQYEPDPLNGIHQEPPPPDHQQHQHQHQLQELHSQPVQQRIQEQDGQSHQHNLDQQHRQQHQHQQSQQPELRVESQVQEQHQDSLQSQLSSPRTDGSLNSESSGLSEPRRSSQSAGQTDQEEGSTKRRDDRPPAKSKRKKKGGKAKGTLETSVEIRNRMIGMAEAGLSTLSIALAIDRSERTVKRWLERWHKEGNVQTKERKGRRRITTKEEDEAIVAMATQHPLTAAKYVAPALGLKCSVDTIRERLHKAGIHSWKLGKKQGEGNAVHTVHLWQPSGNRPNKPKIPGEKKKRSATARKKDQGTVNGQRRPSRKTKMEEDPLKVVPPPANIIPEQTTAVSGIPYHGSAAMGSYVPGPTSLMPAVHNIAGAAATGLVQVEAAVPGPVPAPPAPGPVAPVGHPAQQLHPMQPALIQQRPDCRLAASTLLPPVSGQANPAGVVYPSCMVATSNTHTGHMDQPDPLNYEPYIWSF